MQALGGCPLPTSSHKVAKNRKPAIDSTRRLPLIPRESCHPTRGLGATYDAGRTHRYPASFSTQREEQMPAQRLAMRQVREVLRLKWAIGLSERKIAHGLGISRPTVAEYVRRAQAVGLSWPLPTLLDEAALEQLLFPALPPRQAAPHPIPDWSTVHQELKRKGVTLFLLWQEYKAVTPDGFQYSWFCQAYRAWAAKLDLFMRQPHRAGEKLFVDYAGQSIPVVNG